MWFVDTEIINKLKSGNNIYKKKYKINSLKVINSSLKRIFKNVFGKDISFNVDLLITRFTDIRNYINKLKKTSIQKSMINSIRVVLLNNELYDAYYKKLWNKYSKKHDMLYKYSKQKSDDFINLESLRKIANLETVGTVRYIIANLYTYIPPLRGEEYYNLSVNATKSNKINTLNTKDWIIYIYNYKTMDRYGLRKIRVPVALRPILKKWIDDNKITKNHYLLTNRYGEPFSQSAFTKTLKRIFSISVDMLRRIYMSEMVKYLNSIDEIKWRKRLTTIVGHSLESQEFIYSNHKNMKNIKFSKKIYMKYLFNILKEVYVK